MENETKICKKCEVEKSLDEFYSYFSKDRNATRYENKCKECKKSDAMPRNKKYYKENREKRQKYFKEKYQERKLKEQDKKQQDE